MELPEKDQSAVFRMLDTMSSLSTPRRGRAGHLTNKPSQRPNFFSSMTYP